jgi:hypothetical protein
LLLLDEKQKHELSNDRKFNQPVVVVFILTTPRVFNKIIGKRTAAAQIKPKAIIKANVLGQVEQPKQPCVGVSIPGCAR